MLNHTHVFNMFTFFLHSKYFFSKYFLIRIFSLSHVLFGQPGLSLEALVLCAGTFQLPLPTLPSRSEPRPFRSEVTCRQDVEVQAISSTLRSGYAWEADVCYPLGHASGNLATL